MERAGTGDRACLCTCEGFAGYAMLNARIMPWQAATRPGFPCDLLCQPGLQAGGLWHTVANCPADLLDYPYAAWQQVTELQLELDGARAECQLLEPLQAVNASLVRDAERAAEQVAELQVQLGQLQLSAACSAKVSCGPICLYYAPFHLLMLFVCTSISGQLDVCLHACNCICSHDRSCIMLHVNGFD